MESTAKAAGLFGAYFLGLGLYLPFFPVVLAEAGHGPAAVGLLLAVPLVVRIVANPVMSAFVERRQASRGALIAYPLLAALALGAVAAVSNFWLTAALLAVFAALWSPILPLCDALALRLVRLGRGDYGRMRLWGSLTFVAATLAGGALIETTSGRGILAAMAAGLVVVAAIAFTLPPEPPAAQAGAGAGGGLKVFRRPAVLVVLTAAGLIQASHAAYYAFGSLYWIAHGISETTVGALWAIGVVTEVLLFFAAGRMAPFVGPIGFLLIGGIAGCLRWALFAAATGPAAIAALQVLHGLSFGATHLGAVGYLARVVPARWSGTGQGMLTTAISLASALATMAAGPLYAAAPGSAFLAMAAMAAAACLLIIVLRTPLTRLLAAAESA